MPPNPLDAVDRLKRELDALRPLPPDTVARVAQKLRIDANYHSNAIEGNSLTLGETRSLILHGLTARGKPMRDHIDVQGHDDAVKAVEAAVRDERGLTQEFIRNLHRVLLREPYEASALTPDGGRAKRTIRVGAYKAAPNNVRTSTGETYFFTPPERVQMEMTDLLDWVRRREEEGEHPVILAATFHYRFVRIHPFDDGNGRMARLLMNMILIRHGYAVAIVRQDDRERYIGELERIDRAGQLAGFIEFIASCCEHTFDLHLRAARGESIEDEDDIDKEVALFKNALVANAGYEETEIRPYVKNVLFPFYVHCKAKIANFSALFISIPSPRGGISGTNSSSHQFRFSISVSDEDDEGAFPVFHGELYVDHLPEMSKEYKFELSFRMQGFLKDDMDVEIYLANSVKWKSSEWTFVYSVGDRSHTDNFEGYFLDRLQERFNRLLRHVMKMLQNPEK